MYEFAFVQSHRVYGIYAGERDLRLEFAVATSNTILVLNGEGWGNTDIEVKIGKTTLREAAEKLLSEIRVPGSEEFYVKPDEHWFCDITRAWAHKIGEDELSELWEIPASDLKIELLNEKGHPLEEGKLALARNFKVEGPDIITSMVRSVVMSKLEYDSTEPLFYRVEMWKKPWVYGKGNIE